VKVALQCILQSFEVEEHLADLLALTDDVDRLIHAIDVDESDAESLGDAKTR
jgi:hypothetical protein